MSRRRQRALALAIGLALAAVAGSALATLWPLREPPGIDREAVLELLE